MKIVDLYGENNLYYIGFEKFLCFSFIHLKRSIA